MIYLCVSTSSSMKPNTTAKLKTIALLLAKDNPEVFKQMCEKSEPMLRNASIVPQIKDKITEQFPELDRTDQSILFTATVYFAYAPAIMESDDLERLPNGIRPQMCDVMQWKDAPTCNYYANIGRVYFKGKLFKEKVNHVLSFFQGYTVKPNQIELF